MCTFLQNLGLSATFVKLMFWMQVIHEMDYRTILAVNPQKQPEFPMMNSRVLMLSDSTTQQLCQLHHIPRVKVIASLRRDILDLSGTKLQRALNVRRLQTAGPGGS